MSAIAEPSGFTPLEGERYLAITTFRRDGSEATTPVWFVSDDLARRLFVATGAATWKVRRIKWNPHVLVAPCTGRGRITGPPIEATARVVDEGPLVRRLQAEKYGWQKWLIERAYALTRWVTRKPEEKPVFLEIVPRRELEVATRHAA